MSKPKRTVKPIVATQPASPPRLSSSRNMRLDVNYAKYPCPRGDRGLIEIEGNEEALLYFRNMCERALVGEVAATSNGSLLFVVRRTA